MTSLVGAGAAWEETDGDAKHNNTEIRNIRDAFAMGFFAFFASKKSIPVENVGSRGSKSSSCVRLPDPSSSRVGWKSIAL
jgi:hypothetical protein